MTYSVGIIGTGDPDAESDENGFAMAYRHADVYESLDECELVACADLIPENAERFAAAYELGEKAAYEDHETMLDEMEPDVVSVCVPPAVHSPITIDCAQRGVEAVHCEKPMAATWGDAKRMAQECWRRDVQLTFNHQRRFSPPWEEAYRVSEDGHIGDLQRVELSPPNLYDWGTHLIDLAGKFNDESPADWVIGQIDYREENKWFGVHNENQAYGLWKYENGVDGVISTGKGSSLVPAFQRFVGTDGIIDVHPTDEEDTDVRVRRSDESEWERVECPEYEWVEPIGAAIENVISCLDSGESSPLAARNALTATEIIFAVWESARRRGRVDLPLTVDDNPLEAMVETSELTPEPTPDDRD